MVVNRLSTIAFPLLTRLLSVEKKQQCPEVKYPETDYFGGSRVNPPPVKREQPKTLLMVHALFRHGDRTNDTPYIYPNDEYIDEPYEPYGRGQLTNPGKRKAYALGKFLRERYDELLGTDYRVAKPYSTDFARTKMSLQLVLAAMFPPNDELVWHDDLPWQPLPYECVKVEKDTLLQGPHSCPDYANLYKCEVHSPHMREEYKKYRDLFRWLSEKTGWLVTDFSYLWTLYFCLSTETEFGLPQPCWTDLRFNEIKQLAARQYEVASATIPLKQIHSGPLLDKILKDSLFLFADEKGCTDIKMYLYSAHESNIAYMLNALGVFKPHIPPYSSCLIFEVHKIQDVVGFKIYYLDYSQEEPKLLHLPNFQEPFYPIDEFIDYVRDILPETSTCKRKKI